MSCAMHGQSAKVGQGGSSTCQGGTPRRTGRGTPAAGRPAHPPGQPHGCTAGTRRGICQRDGCELLLLRSRLHARAAAVLFRIPEACGGRLHQCRHFGGARLRHLHLGCRGSALGAASQCRQQRATVGRSLAVLLCRNAGPAEALSYMPCTARPATRLAVQPAMQGAALCCLRTHLAAPPR